jgi:hypothetical protein
MDIPLSFSAKPHFLNKKVEYFSPSNSHHFFPHSVYFLEKYGTASSVLDFETPISNDILPFLERNAELVTERNTIPSQNASSSGVHGTSDFWDDSEAHQHKLFFYKDCLIELEKTQSKKVKKEGCNYKITIHYPSCVQPPLEDLKSFFIVEDIKNIIFTVMRDEHGSIRFEPFEVRIPESYNIEKCYNDDFPKIHNVVVDSLNKNESGLYLFHGDPGTGKTTYIKYLSSLVKRDMIYIPTSFVEHLADPSFLPALLHKKHSVLVIEDAEKALLARDPSDSSSLVSAILNITDGMMADVFNIAVIATYNSPRQAIDKALLRKGRLKVEYHFGKLKASKAQKIADENNIKYQVNNDISLADLYNTDENSSIVSPELLEEKRMGFC